MIKFFLPENDVSFIKLFYILPRTFMKNNDLFKVFLVLYKPIRSLYSNISYTIYTPNKFVQY